MEFRFGVNMLASAGRAHWIDLCRKAERLGYDVVAVPDHLGMPAPFPALVAAAEATERVRLGTYVVNTGFYNPVLLARDVEGVDQLLEGRFELGLGTGYVKAEFDAAGLPFLSPGKRLDHLERCIEAIREHYGDRTPPPLFLGGQRDRMLRLAAREADIVGFTGVRFSRDGDSAAIASPDELDERIAFVRSEAGDRADGLELNLLIQSVVVTDDRSAVLEQLRRYDPDRTPEELGEVPILLVGTVEQIAEQLRAQRERFGITYVSVMDKDLDAFAEVIAHLRGGKPLTR
ncbi:LLM class F420-dependent oxidoreductase [Prauserella oleivorans]|uniref:LLM class F420-dependent oxidoreductase n=1 Tax=Prauserella oleivorans TaxID=1478153 RepID=A0ABW5WK80_9PSEU